MPLNRLICLLIMSLGWKECCYEDEDEVVWKLSTTDCVHKKRQHQLGLGERFFQRSLIVPTVQASLARDLPTSFALGHVGLAEKPWRGIPGPSQALFQLVLPGIKLATTTSQVGDITKSTPRRLHLELWVCFIGCKLDGSSAVSGNTTSVPHRLTNHWIILQN